MPPNLLREPRPTARPDEGLHLKIEDRQDGRMPSVRAYDGSLMVEHGADIRVIQEMPGHVKLSTTESYLRGSRRGGSAQAARRDAG